MMKVPFPAILISNSGLFLELRLSKIRACVATVILSSLGKIPQTSYQCHTSMVKFISRPIWLIEALNVTTFLILNVFDYLQQSEAIALIRYERLLLIATQITFHFPANHKHSPKGTSFCLFGKFSRYAFYRFLRRNRHKLQNEN